MKPTILACLALAALAPAQDRVDRHGVFERAFTAKGSYANPYTEVRAEAAFMRPGGGVWRIPLFWDGGATWKVRISPDAGGAWSFKVESNDRGLNGASGRFTVAESQRPGGIVASAKWPGHFERQNGKPFWFLGDTAWAYVTDVVSDKHDRAAAELYLKRRASQGFNAIHVMMLSEGGDGNSKGMPWASIEQEKINPAYFQEAEDRIRFANANGVTVGIALAWGDKRKEEKFPWRRMPNVEARKRYARSIAARFSAYDVYFIVSGEWHGEVRTRPASEKEMFAEFVEIGAAFAAAEPHGRLKGIHPMTDQGSTREFARTGWAGFADYQQNYERLHDRVLLSRALAGPVVNSEYGYYLRDQNGDGKPDKSNSYTLEDMRFSSWDIVTAGGYLVTGFGTTYFGGHRDPGPFDPMAEKNRDWETQIGHIKKLYESLEWWKLAPADELLRGKGPRGDDVRSAPRAGQRTGDLHPPESTWWAMADPGRTYLVYARGTAEPLQLDLGARAGRYKIRTFNPRTGEFGAAAEAELKGRYTFTPPDKQDWVALLQLAE